MQCPEIFAIYLLLLTSLSKHVSRKTQTHIYESFPLEFLLAPTSHRIFRIHSPGSKSQYNNPPVLQSAPEQMVQTSDLLLFSIFLSCISFQNFLEPIQNHGTVIEPEIFYTLIALEEACLMYHSTC